MAGISFFIPAYNCEKTIAESVDSIMESNFQIGDELLIVNDCSTDNTASILAGLQTKYPAIQIIHHKNNKGGAAARNAAVEVSNNKLLFCLDSDNVLAPSSIAALKNYLEDTGADIASFQYQHYFLTDKLKPEYTWALPAGEFNLQSYLNGNNTPGQHGNYLFTKQSWLNAKGYAENTGALDTWTFGLKQAITGAKTVVLKDTYYYHRLDYANSYWMRDAEANLWTVSIKVASALLPFLEKIDEKFVAYMLGPARYSWFYTLKNKPIKLAEQGSKNNFYNRINAKTKTLAYPKPSVFTRAINKITRSFK